VEKITIFARMSVKPVDVEELKALAVEGCNVAAEEPGTLTYDWHYSEEQRSHVLLETYADSAAHLEHSPAAARSRRPPPRPIPRSPPPHHPRTTEPVQDQDTRRPKDPGPRAFRVWRWRTR
jgi:quinol monooxygenase YgiN